MTFDVFYDLYEFTSGIFLPTAYIASLDRDGYLTHIQQRALPETIGSFGLELDPVRKELFSILESLQPKALEKRFRPAKGKGIDLGKLLAGKDTKGPVRNYIHRRLDGFLTILVRHRLPLTWQVERKVLVKDFLLDYGEEILLPHLSFRRTGQGVHYRLRLDNGSAPWTVSSREVMPVTNHPAWLVVDNRLVRVAHINGNMVIPFQKKDELLIPEASVKAYFKRFILKVAARVDIDAEGFDLVHHQQLLGCRLVPTHDLFTGRWLLAVRMLYPQSEFNWSDTQEKRTTLEFEGEEVRIIKIRRDFRAEKTLLTRLPELGLQRTGGNFYDLSTPDDDPLFLLEWLTDNRSRLEAAGFELDFPEVEAQNLNLLPASLELGLGTENDWFDIYGTVIVGEFSFPFLKLAPYIRAGERFFPLPNGELFLIPREWLSRYKTLFQFGRKEGKHLRLNKSQFTLLEESGLSVPARPEGLADDFQPSPALRAQLRPYQLEGVRWLVELYRNQLGACLADDMGLGKTLQTIAALLHAKEEKGIRLAEKPKDEQQLTLFDSVPDADTLQPLNALIILPASLVYNWEEELRKFAPSLTVYRHTGPRRHRDRRLLARFDLLLTTYQTALRDVELLEEMEFEYIVLDESQQIKNRESKAFKAINKLNGKHKISLSGTPIENSLSDLWSQMQFINPDLLGSFAFFRREFLNPIEKYRNEEKKARLRTLVAPYLLRRTKEQVAQDLPPLTTRLFHSEMTTEQRRLYEREKSAARNYLLEHFDAKNPQYRILVLQSLTKLRQLANHPRLVLDQYQRESGKFTDVLENWEVIRKSGHKVLFFSSFVKYLTLFRECFEEQAQPFAWLTGELSSHEREKQIRRFEEDPVTQAFFISIKAGGTGLNLTAADYVFILDPWWNPTTEQQAIARAHRIGQDKHVIATKFITRDSIEEKILRLQERKAKLAEDILDQAGKADFSRSDIEFLFE